MWDELRLSMLLTRGAAQPDTDLPVPAADDVAYLIYTSARRGA
ncbi:hypothetical protein I552_0123 [Mycobacterium xenopi 3993]|nr:hypothetical protein I552_0123 [Mycobacterium xenopi 3993]